MKKKHFETFVGGGSERVSCKALVWSRMDLRGGDVQETSPFEMFAPAKTLGQGPSVVKGKHLRFLSGHSLEASVLKKAQLPARRGHRAEAVEQPGQIPHTAVPRSTYGKSKGILLFLWLIPTSGFSNSGLCMFRGRVFL